MSRALDYKRRMLAGGIATAPAAAQPYTAGEALNSPANAQKHLALMVASLEKDLERLSALNSLEAKATLKRDELLPKYQDYVTRYFQAGLQYPNPVLVRVVIWLYDTEQFEEGLAMALLAIADGQELPESFSRRDLQTFVADEVLTWAEQEQKFGRSPEPYLSQLLPYVDGAWEGLAEEDRREQPWLLFEKIPAKYHRLLGLLAMDREEWGTAIVHFKRAEALHPEIGVKTRREAAEKALRKQELEAGTNQSSDT